MTPIRLLLLLLVTAVPPAAARAHIVAQDPPDAAPPSAPGPVVGSEAGATPGDQLLASDGKPAVPGRIPDDATPAAVQLWRGFAQATRGPRREPLLSLDVSFEIQVRAPGKFNEINAAFQFLDHPRGTCLRAHFERGDRVSLRGPRGDFLIEAGQAEAMVGSQFEDDRRQLDEWSTIAGNFLALAQPERVRLLELSAPQVAPPAAPDGTPEPPGRLSFLGADALELPDERMAREARKLHWLQLRSPDFGLYQRRARSAETPVYRALLGLDPESLEVRMAVLNEDIDSTIVLETALLVLVEGYTAIEPGYRVPSSLEVREVDPNPSPWTFARRDGTTLFLKKGGRLNPPDLKPGSFIPAGRPR